MFDALKVVIQHASVCMGLHLGGSSKSQVESFRTGSYSPSPYLYLLPPPLTSTRHGEEDSPYTVEIHTTTEWDVGKEKEILTLSGERALKGVSWGGDSPASGKVKNAYS